MKWLWDRKEINAMLPEEKTRSDLEDFPPLCKEKSSRDEWDFPSRSVAFIFLRSLLVFLILQGICSASEFEDLMGRNTAHWKYVSQLEDQLTLKAAQDLYEKNKEFQFEKTGAFRIPPVIHFIWLGPKHFPPQSVENIRTWIAQNPDWKVKFWTDREREVPCQGIEMVDVKDFTFTRLGMCYAGSDNWGEKSDVLRYEILLQEGGVYADHDANCLKSFDGLHQGYDFYCCLETPHEPFVGLNITCGNGVIGARSQHPSIKKVVDLIGDRWETIGNIYRGRDEYSRIEIVMQRTYIALTHALKETVGLAGNRDIILPASYFFAKSHMTSLYSKHFYATAWDDFRVHKSEETKSADKFLGQMEKKSRSLFSATAWILGLNAAILLYIIIKRKRHAPL